MLSGKGVIRVAEGAIATSWGRGVIRGGEGVIRAGQDFQCCIKNLKQKIIIKKTLNLTVFIKEIIYLK